MALLSREALYERVWSEPVRSLAEGFGLSDNGLRKICIGADIPLPERGYWAKLRAGKPLQRKALPPRAPGMPHTLAIGEQSSRFYWRPDPAAELAEPPPEPPQFDEPLEALTARVTERVGRVVFEKALSSSHVLIRELLDADEKRRPRRGEPSWTWRESEPLFDSGFERHRLRILSSLFYGVQKLGARPWLRGETARELGLTVGVTTVTFTLDHPNAKADRYGQWKTWPGTIDTLALSVQGAGARTWLDTEADPLEARLSEVVAHLIVAGEMNYRAGVVAGYEHTLERRREAEAALAKARAEAAIRVRERRIAEERARRETLLEMAADLRRADDIRSLVERLATDAHDEAAGADLWSRWALGVADRLDPTRRLQFEATGHARLAPLQWPDPDDGARSDLLDE